MMNKVSLAEKVQEMLGDISKAESERVVNNIFDTIVEEVSNGGEVSIAGFGSFSSKTRAARMGRNPKTGEAIKIKASRGAKFKAAKAFKDKLN